MSGYYLIKRGMFEHPILATSQPFSPREAWIWLIENANFAPQRFKCGNALHEIPRGSVATHFRTLASEWRWSVNRVIRFVNVLKTDTMVETKTEQGYVLITLCNYELYQNPSTGRGTDTDTSVEQQRNSNGYINKERKEDNNTPLYPPTFDFVWSCFPKQRIGNKEKAHAAWKSALRRATEEEIQAGAVAYAASPEVAKGLAKGLAAWLNDDRWKVNYGPVLPQNVGGNRQWG